MKKMFGPGGVPTPRRPQSAEHKRKIGEGVKTTKLVKVRITASVQVDPPNEELRKFIEEAIYHHTATLSKLAVKFAGIAVRKG